VKEGPVEVDIFGFLTTEPNVLVGAYHPKAMLVILTTPEECDV
jgi:putative SOS response-associated peptidase YedK